MQTHEVKHFNWLHIKCYSEWCGRGDSNSHGLGPTDFKSVMSTIPSRPRGWYVSGDSPANPMMQKESLLYWQKNTVSDLGMKWRRCGNRAQKAGS